MLGSFVSLVVRTLFTFVGLLARPRRSKELKRLPHKILLGHLVRSIRAPRSRPSSPARLVDGVVVPPSMPAPARDPGLNRCR